MGIDTAAQPATASMRDEDPYGDRLGDTVDGARAGAELFAFAPELTPQRLTLGAARLLLQQDLWGRATMPNRSLGWLSLMGSLRVAAGGNYTEDGEPAAPEEPAAARVLERTCDLLAAHLGRTDTTAGMSSAQRLEQLSQVSTADSLYLQRLLATVHGVRPAHR